MIKRSCFKKKYLYSVSDETIQSCISNLNFEFIREKKRKINFSKEIYDFDIINNENDNFSSTFLSYLKQNI
jgi:hypothetical protein